MELSHTQPHPQHYHHSVEVSAGVISESTLSLIGIDLPGKPGQPEWPKFETSTE